MLAFLRLLRFSVNSSNQSGRSPMIDAWLLLLLFLVFVGSPWFLDDWACESSLLCIAGLGEIPPDESFGDDVEWTNLRSSLRKLLTILRQQQARSLPYCTQLFSHSWSAVVFDHWPTSRNNRVLRRTRLTTRLQACLRGFAPSRRAQGRERILWLPHVFALHWLSEPS